MIFLRYRIKSGFYLKGREFGMRFEQKRDDADDMRTSETVSGQTFVTAVEPSRADIYPGRGQFDNFSEFETEIKRVGFRNFTHRNQR